MLGQSWQGVGPTEGGPTSKGVSERAWGLPPSMFGLDPGKNMAASKRSSGWDKIVSDCL